MIELELYVDEDKLWLRDKYSKKPLSKGIVTSVDIKASRRGDNLSWADVSLELYIDGKVSK